MMNVALAVLAAVLPPWTPVETNGTAVSVWGRTYAYASNALPVSVTSQGDELLAGPMRLVVAGENGANVDWKKAGSWVYERTEESATVCAWQEADDFTVNVVATTEFDGMTKLSLAATPSAGQRRNLKLARLWLEIPLKRAYAQLYQFYPFQWGRCANAGVIGEGRSWPFLASVWVGNEKAGLSWFCESDEAFAPVSATNVIEVVPSGEEAVLRIRLVDAPVELPRTFVFGFEATPVRPFDRSWNANHVLHAPQMGAGMTIKRPQVWWTAQRAFPNGDVDASLDAAAQAGVKTIAFHEDWIPIQNNPLSALDDFRPIIEGCHRRGMKAIVYDGYELSPLDPAWGEHHGDWLAHDPQGRPVSYWYREPGQRDYRSCLKSGFGETWLKRAKEAYDKLGIDGYYLDGTICPWGCANAAHGCGWTDGKGVRHATYPIFAVRKVMRELYAFVTARGGIINAHQSGMTCPATLAFAHAYWDGEQVAGRGRDPKAEVSLEVFRAEFMGRNHGVPCEFLCYEVPGVWSYEDACALTLIHDVLPRPCGFVALPRFAPLWKTLDDFGIASAEFLPYWEKPLEVTPDCVKASAYRHKDGRMLCVLANLSKTERVTAELMLPDGSVRTVPLGPYRHSFVRFGD